MFQIQNIFLQITGSFPKYFSYKVPIVKRSDSYREKSNVMANLLEIDGSVLEGGGQILRNSISLSAILGIPVRVTKIRAGRKKPGLAPQHLEGIKLVANMCQATLRGADIGSTEIEFIPRKIKGGEYNALIQTAGSISLLLQVALPCALFADSPVTLLLGGGTNVGMAPPIDYMANVFRNVLRNFGADFELNINRRGFFPKGGGHVEVRINPVKDLSSINLLETRGMFQLEGVSLVSGNIPDKVGYLMIDAARRELPGLNISMCRDDGTRGRKPDNFYGLVVWAQSSLGVSVGADAAGERGGDARVAGARVAADLKAALDSGVGVDQHAQDQVILYMALASGESAVRAGEITLHTFTAIHVAETVAKVKFHIEPDGEHNIIRCTGLGFSNQSLP